MGDTWEAELRQGKQVHTVGDTNVFRREALPGLRFGLVPLLSEGAPSGLAQSRRGGASRLTVLLTDERRHKNGQDLWIKRRGAADPLLQGHLKGVIRVSQQRSPLLRCAPSVQAPTVALFPFDPLECRFRTHVCVWPHPPVAQDRKDHTEAAFRDPSGCAFRQVTHSTESGSPAAPGHTVRQLPAQD